MGRFAIHDEGEEDGRVEEVAFGAGSWGMRIHPSVETEATMLVHSKCVVWRARTARASRRVPRGVAE